FPEDGAPKWSWIGVLVAEALYRVLPVGKAKTFFAGARVAAVVLVVIVALPFLVRHVREAIYPALERPDAMVGSNEVAVDNMGGGGENIAAQAFDLKAAPPPAAEAPPPPKAAAAPSAKDEEQDKGEARRPPLSSPSG